MRIFAKIAEALGITLLFLGVGAMDSASLVLPVVMTLAGLGIAFGGVTIEEAL
jgi:hypothetical protein